MFRRRPSRRTPVILSLLSALLLSAPKGIAGTGERGTPASTFHDRVEVDVVNVEVFVTDSRGHRVRGLDSGDFAVFENGEPVEITNFYAVDRPPAARQQEEDGPKAPLPAVAGAPEGGASAATMGEEGRSDDFPGALPADRQLRLAVYVDASNMRASSRRRALTGVRKWLEQRSGRSDLVMLLSYDGTLRIAEPFTADRQRIAAGLDALEHQVAAGDRLDRARKTTIERFRYDERALANPEGHLRSYVSERRLLAHRSAQAIENAVRSLGVLPGRKALLYVGDGLPMRPGERLRVQLMDEYQPTDREDPLYDTIVRQANAYRVTLYTLDARGPSAGSSISAEFSDEEAGGVSRVQFDGIEALNQQEPLLVLAAETGGAAILNTLNFDQALIPVGEDFDSFYSLGFRSRSGHDGKYHRIEVQVKRPGLRVRHRSGFLAKPQAERVADRMLGALVLERGDNPLAVAVGFGEPTKQHRGVFQVPILVRIPLQGVTLLQRGDVAEGRLRIYLAAKDATGLSPVREHPYPLTIPTENLEEALGHDVGYQTTLALRAGSQLVTVGVWDEISGMESVVQSPIVLGKPGT